MRKLTLWAVSICLVALVMIVGCQCGAPDETSKPAPATIAEPEPTPTPSSTQTTTLTPPALTMLLYENMEHGFSIEYPEGWDETSHGGATSYYIQVNEPEGSLSISLSVDYRPEAISLADAVSESKEYMESVPQYELFFEGDVTIGEGLSGYEMIGQGKETSAEVEKFRYVVLVREKQIFWVGVDGEPSRFDEQRQLVDTVIDSFKLMPSYTYEPLAPSTGGTYNNAEYGFSITYPAGWDDYTTGQYGEIVDLRAAAGIPGVTVRATKLTEETTFNQAASDIQVMYGENIGDYELLSEGEITLDDGTPAYEFVFSGTMQGYLLKTKCIIVIRGDDEFVMTGYSIPGSFEQDEPILDEVTGSFHLD
jgi:hypothetical protein